MRPYRFELQWVDIPNRPGRREHSRQFEEIDTAVFHRIHAGKPEKDTCATIADFFNREGKRWTGTHRMPYPFIIPRTQPNGEVIVIEQCQTMWMMGPHAKDWNRRSLGIGVVGDFRTMKPTKKQRAACLWLAQRLLDLCTPHLQKRKTETKKDFLVTVHGALTTGTSDKTKLIGGENECPGPLFLPTWRDIRRVLTASGKVKL